MPKEEDNVKYTTMLIRINAQEFLTAGHTEKHGQNQRNFDCLLEHPLIPP
jgi:hypothetical protein